MGDVLDMITKKPRKFDCQGEEPIDEPRSQAARALSRCVRMMQADFGDAYASQCLSNELLRVKYGRK
jgi:hypothetical protein